MATWRRDESQGLAWGCSARVLHQGLLLPGPLPTPRRQGAVIPEDPETGPPEPVALGESPSSRQGDGPGLPACSPPWRPPTCPAGPAGSGVTGGARKPVQLLQPLRGSGAALWRVERSLPLQTPHISAVGARRAAQPGQDLGAVSSGRAGPLGSLGRIVTRPQGCFPWAPATPPCPPPSRGTRAELLVRATQPYSQAPPAGVAAPQASSALRTLCTLYLPGILLRKEHERGSGSL